MAYEILHFEHIYFKKTIFIFSVPLLSPYIAVFPVSLHSVYCHLLRQCPPHSLSVPPYPAAPVSVKLIRLQSGIRVLTIIVGNIHLTVHSIISLLQLIKKNVSK